MRKLISILILLSCINIVSALDYQNTSFNPLMGENVIVPYYPQNDSYFALYNDGGARYMIYQYDYMGTLSGILDGFVGCVEPNQIMMLNNNASYHIYADYNDIRDLGDPDIVIDKIQSWWYVIIYLILIIVTVLAVWRVIRK